MPSMGIIYVVKVHESPRKEGRFRRRQGCPKKARPAARKDREAGWSQPNEESGGSPSRSSRLSEQRTFERPIQGVRCPQPPKPEILSVT